MEYQKYLKYLKLFGFKFVNDINLKNTLKIKSLNELNIHLQNCSLCNLSNTTKYKNINNQTNIKVIFIVNKFYGYNEPFSLKEKEIFQKIISNVLNLKKEDFIVLPIIKCQALMPINSSYFNLCKNYILNELELIKSKLIVTFGDSFDVLFNSNFINIRGNLIKLNNLKIIPTYDINYIIKNPTKKIEFYNDLKKIKYTLEKI